MKLELKHNYFYVFIWEEDDEDYTRIACDAAGKILSWKTEGEAKDHIKENDLEAIVGQNIN